MPQRQLTETELRQLVLLCAYTAWAIPAFFTAQILEFEKAIDTDKFEGLQEIAAQIRKDFKERFLEAVKSINEVS